LVISLISFEILVNFDKSITKPALNFINKAALIGKLHRCKDKLKGKRGIAKTNYMYEQENFLIPLQTFAYALPCHFVVTKMFFKTFPILLSI
jgi:hypothetical protein